MNALRWLVLSGVTNFVLFALHPVSAQEPAADAVAFETASIRPSHFTDGCFSMLQPGSTHYAVTCMTLRGLIAVANGMQFDRVEGADVHVLDAYYDVTATTPGDQPWTQETLRPMLRRLLAERFHLTVHPSSKQVSGFGLYVAKGGARFQPVAPEAPQGYKAGQAARNFTMPGKLQAHGAEMKVVSAMLGFLTHQPVEDHTGLAGLYNIDLTFAPDDKPDSTLPGLYTALTEQLGLKMQPEKVMVETLVVDHVDAEPTSN